MNSTYEVRQKEALDWPLATASVALQMDGDKVRDRADCSRPRRSGAMARGGGVQSLAGKSITTETAAAAGDAAVQGAKPLSQILTKSNWRASP